MASLVVAMNVLVDSQQLVIRHAHASKGMAPKCNEVSNVDTQI